MLAALNPTDFRDVCDVDEKKLAFIQWTQRCHVCRYHAQSMQFALLVP